MFSLNMNRFSFVSVGTALLCQPCGTKKNHTVHWRSLTMKNIDVKE